MGKEDNKQQGPNLGQELQQALCKLTDESDRLLQLARGVLRAGDLDGNVTGVAVTLKAAGDIAGTAGEIILGGTRAGVIF